MSGDSGNMSEQEEQIAVVAASPLDLNMDSNGEVEGRPMEIDEKGFKEAQEKDLEKAKKIEEGREIGDWRDEEEKDNEGLKKEEEKGEGQEDVEIDPELKEMDEELATLDLTLRRKESRSSRS